MKTLEDAKRVARDKFAWPGGYPLYLVTTDGGALCPKCVRKEFREIAGAAISKVNNGWRPAGADINYENNELFCDHCNEQIPAAYSPE